MHNKQVVCLNLSKSALGTGALSRLIHMIISAATCPTHRESSSCCPKPQRCCLSPFARSNTCSIRCRILSGSFSGPCCQYLIDLFIWLRVCDSWTTTTTTLARLLHSHRDSGTKRLLTFTSHVAVVFRTAAIRASRSRYIEPLVKADRERGHTRLVHATLVR